MAGDSIYLNVTGQIIIVASVTRPGLYQGLVHLPHSGRRRHHSERLFRQDLVVGDFPPLREEQPQTPAQTVQPAYTKKTGDNQALFMAFPALG